MTISATGRRVRRRAIALFAAISPEWGDALVYLVGAIFAVVTFYTSGLALYRQWSELALGPYIAGALIATFFYVVPTVGETLGIVAFVTVSLGGFGSVPGALVAGLLIGVIESLSAYWIGAVYKDIVVYSLFLCFLWFRPQGLMGKS